MSSYKPKYAGKWWTRRLPLAESEEVALVRDMFYYSGWGNLPGHLYLTNQRLFFLPAPVTLISPRRVWKLSEIQALGLEKWRWRWTHAIPAKTWYVQANSVRHYFGSLGLTRPDWPLAIREATGLQGIDGNGE
jgi:hypothetical protein